MKRSAGVVLRILLLALLLAGALVAHDTWLIPASFRVTAGEPVKVAFNTSMEFPTSDGAAGPDRIARFEAVTADGAVDVTGYRVDGKSLVAEVTPGEGLTYVAAVTKARLIELEHKDFNGYIGDEGLEQIVEARASRGETYAVGRERYSKVAKLVLCADEPSNSNARRYRTPMGLRVEIVPLTSPCGLKAGDVLAVQVFFEGRPLPHVWVSSGTEGTHGHEYPFRQKTDAAGRVVVPLPQAGPWFVRALHMVPNTEFDDADWQSWFSTLTFAVE